MATPGVSRRRTLTGLAGVGVGLPVLAACGDDGGTTAADDPSSSSSPSDPASSPASSPAAPSDTAEPSTPSAPDALASTADIPVGGGAIFADAGVVVTQPEAGTFKGFSVVCTHRQCPVSEVSTTINCVCHGSKFSIVDGAPQDGSPATDPLGSIALTVEGDQISLA